MGEYKLTLSKQGHRRRGILAVLISKARNIDERASPPRFCFISLSDPRCTGHQPQFQTVARQGFHSAQNLSLLQDMAC